MRYYTFINPDQPQIDGIPMFQWQLNNVYYNVIYATPNEILFGFKLQKPLEVLAQAEKPKEEVAENLPFVRSAIRKQADLALSLATSKAKIKYNVNYKLVEFNVGDEVYLRLH